MELARCRICRRRERVSRLRLPESLGALHEREFRMLFLGQAVSLLGDGMVGVALAFAVLDLTGSIGDLGLVFAARTIPMVVFLLVGGVFADRLPRRAVMLNADVARLITQGTIAVLLISGRAQIWQLVLTQAVYGTATAFFNPASTGLSRPSSAPAACSRRTRCARCRWRPGTWPGRRSRASWWRPRAPDGRWQSTPRASA